MAYPEYATSIPRIYISFPNPFMSKWVVTCSFRT